MEKIAYYKEEILKIAKTTNKMREWALADALGHYSEGIYMDIEDKLLKDPRYNAPDSDEAFNDEANKMYQQRMNQLKNKIKNHPEFNNYVSEYEHNRKREESPRSKLETPLTLGGMIAGASIPHVARKLYSGSFKPQGKSLMLGRTLGLGLAGGLAGAIPGMRLSDKKRDKEFGKRKNEAYNKIVEDINL